MMKKTINEVERKNFISISRIYAIELFIMILSAYPLLKFLNVIGIVIWGMIVVVTIITAFKVEKLKKEYDIQTYKEIVAFYENKSLTHDEKLEEKGKIPYQKVLYVVLSAVIAFVVFLLLTKLLG